MRRGFWPQDFFGVGSNVTTTGVSVGPPWRVSVEVEMNRLMAQDAHHQILNREEILAV